MISVMPALIPICRAWGATSAGARCAISLQFASH
jgi:hypothetical protein